MLPQLEDLPLPPNRLPDFEEDFSAGLSPQRWVPHYLPHWTTPDRSEARYGFVPGALELRVEQDQLDWRPEDAPLRVSNLQTGLFSGPIGSQRGTHRHRDDVYVRTETPQQMLFAPSGGRLDVTVAASRDAGCMLAAWLVGTEHLSNEDSAEICIFEIDADAIAPTRTAVRSGIKAHRDPRVIDDMTEIVVPLDASKPHTWTVIWDSYKTIIGCDGRVVRRLAQGLTYPLFLMIDLFEIGPPSGSYPKSATIFHVRGWAS